MMAYYRCLGQFWKEMSHIFSCLSDRYDKCEIQTIPDIVEHILDSLKKKAHESIFHEAVKLSKSLETAGQIAFKLQNH